MATVVNARDVRLQAAPTRVANVSMAPNLIVDQSQVTGLGIVVAGTKMVSLAATTQVFQIAKNGTVSPTSSVLTASLRNITGTPTLTVVSGTISPTPVLSGGAVTINNANMTTNSATLRLSVTDGGVTYTDEVTIVKVREGIDSLTGFLTNESAAITADSLGNPLSYFGVGGNFKVFQGINDVSSVCTYALVAGGNPNSLTYTLNAATGAYAVTGGYPVGIDLTTLTFRATFGTSTLDKVFTISKSKAGANGNSSVSGYLTNESHTVATDAAGAGGSYTNAGGGFKVFDGLTDVTSNPACVFSISGAATTGLTASINATTGIYTASLNTATDTGVVTFRATYNGVTIDKRYTLSKSKGGVAGINGVPGAAAPLVTLSADRQAITFNSAGVATPSAQTIKFALQRQNLTTADSWLVEDADGNMLEPVSSYSGSSSGLGFEGLTMSVSEFNSARGSTTGVRFTTRIPYGLIESYQSLLEDGWAAVGGTLSATTGGVATFTTTAANPRLEKTITSLGLTGAQIKGVRIQARRISGTGDFEGNFYYANAIHSYTTGFYKHAPRQGTLESWAYYDFDMRSLTVGDVADWDDNIVNSIRIDLTSETGQVWEIDYIALYTDILSDTVSVVKVQDGAAGANGTNGTNGAAGVRGSRTFYVALSGSTNTYSTSLATTTASVDGGPVRNDTVVQYNDGITPGFSETRFWNGTSWLVVNAIVDGNLLVNGTVGATAISADSIDATKLKSNSVTAAKILADAVTSSKIAAGAVQAEHILANSITADKLLVSGSNLIANGDFRTGTMAGWLLWTGAVGTFEVFDFTNGSQPPPAKYAGRFFGSGTAVAQSSVFAHVDAYNGTVNARNAGFEVLPGEEYYLSVYCYKNSAFDGDGLECRIYYQLNDGTFAGTSSGTTINVVPTGTWAKYEGTFTPPATAVCGWLIVTARNFANGAMYFTKCYVAPKTSSVTIKDGAITAGKIAADAVTASKINVTSLSAITATIGTLRTASTGSRMELKDNVIKIYDGSTLRVQIGNLDL